MSFTNQHFQIVYCIKDFLVIFHHQHLQMLQMKFLDFIRSKSKIQLITSPNLSDTDKQLFEQSVLEGEKLLSTIFLDDLENDPDNLKLEFTKLMSYMLTNNIDGKPQLEIKIAIPNTGPGLFHQKNWNSKI